MLKKLLVLLLLVLAGCQGLHVGIPENESASRIIGQDYLALQQPHWNLVPTQKYFPGGSALGILDHTFGDSFTPLRSLLSSSHPLYFRVHLLNTVCIRHARCGRYEVGYGYTVASFNAAVLARKKEILSFVRKRTTLYRALSTEFPETTFLISPALEHNLTPAAWQVLADTVKETWPEVQLVNNEMNGNGQRYRKALLEHHGSTPKANADIVSLDGSDATGIDIDSFLSKTRTKFITFLWTLSYNCSANGVFMDPRIRKSCSQATTLELMAHISDTRPPAPAFRGNACPNRARFESPSIGKPLAEDSGGGDPRANLPVVITKKLKPVDINILSADGDVVGRLGYYGTYLDKGFRYYSGWKRGSRKSGYEFEKFASAVSNSPWVWLQTGNVCEGPLLMGKREGDYR